MTIRQSLVLLASLCACSPLLNAQEVKTTLTVQKCRIVIQGWTNKLEGSKRDSISFVQAASHDQVISECVKIDPDFTEQYASGAVKAEDIERTRLVNFIERHGLWHQFIDEDAQGKR